MGRINRWWAGLGVTRLWKWRCEMEGEMGELRNRVERLEQSGPVTRVPRVLLSMDERDRKIAEEAEKRFR